MLLIEIPSDRLPTLEAALCNGAEGILEDKTLNSTPRGRRDAADQAQILIDLRLVVLSHRQASPHHGLGPRWPASVIGE